MSDRITYDEQVVSGRTEFLFIALTLVSFILFTWRLMVSGLDILWGAFLFFFCFFLFCSLNYRMLTICLTSESLKLSFGIVTWTVPLSNVSECQLDDDLPVLMKYGGAGIHSMFIRKRYRASFKFLEHPRVVVRLKIKAGLVKDIPFSTRQPNELVRLIQGAICANRTA